MEKIIVLEEETKRIDKYLSEKLDYSRAYVQKLLDEDLIQVNDKTVKASYKVVLNDVITIL